MGIKIAAGGAVLLLAVLFFSGCIFGGGGDDSSSLTRGGPIPTATLPAPLPEPVVLGSSDVTNTTTTNSGSGNSYTVVSGDTLFGIAAKLNIPSEQQAAWTAEVLRLNGIPDASLLAAGVILRLPATPTPTPGPSRTPTPAAGTPRASGTPAPTTSSGAPTATRPPATATPGSGVTGGGGTYTVVDGDYPLLIAQKLGASNPAVYAQQIVDLNGVDPQNLRVGQVLQLPPLN